MGISDYFKLVLKKGKCPDNNVGTISVFNGSIINPTLYFKKSERKE